MAKKAKQTKANTVHPKMIYSIKPREGSQSHVVSAMAHLRMFDKTLVTNDNVSSILSKDKRLDKECVEQFTNAIYETPEVVIIVVNGHYDSIRAIMSQGIEIGYDMPKYLQALDISFANDCDTVKKAVIKNVSFDTEIFIIQNKIN